MSNKDTTPKSPAGSGKDKKKAKIRKGKRWVEVDVDDEVRKASFRYVKFTDEDGLETYWLSPE